jgi:GNAT superfamily N-acetyltransferase
MKLPDGYQLTEDMHRMDFDRIQTWLTTTYWVPGITQAEMERSAKNSALVLGVFDGQGTQVAFMRLVSDKTRFAYLMDVFVDPAHRGKGLATAMVQYAFDHPDFKTVIHWLLGTRDAQEVYKPLGFKALEFPERWMALMRPWTAEKREV